MKRLWNKVAVITGATSGIGEASAKRFAEEGAYVFCLGRNEEHGAKIIAEIKEKGGAAAFVPCDVTKTRNIEQAADVVKEQAGAIDILFNNAGIFVTRLLDEADDEIFDRVFQTNVRGMMMSTKYFKRLFRDGRGCILNMASHGGLEGYTAGVRQYIYAPSKAATIKFTQLCALNFAPNIRVNALCPGPTDTPIFTNRDFSRFAGIPLGRMGTVDDVANAAVFLVSEDASYITGALLPIDGGGSLQ